MSIVYAPSELAKSWNCCPNTIRKAIMDGDLRAFRVGKLMRIPAENVLEFERGSSPIR